MKKNAKKISIYLLVLILFSALLSLIDKRIQLDNILFHHLLLEKLFLVNMLLFIITGIIFIDDRGTFNIFKYSMKHYKATVSKKYKYYLQSEYSLSTPGEIKEFLREKYLYADKKNGPTTIFFYSSIAIMFLYILFILL